MVDLAFELGIDVVVAALLAVGIGLAVRLLRVDAGAHERRLPRVDVLLGLAAQLQVLVILRAIDKFHGQLLSALPVAGPYETSTL